MSSTATQVADALLDIAEGQLAGCGRAPDLRLVYHGKLPQVCCTAKGALTIRWARIFAADTTPNPVPAKWHTTGRLAVIFTLRLDRCWPLPPADLAAWLATDFDGAAKLLLDDALAVEMALRAVSCDSGDLAALIGCHAISVGEATPVPAFGGCAAIEWAVTVSLRTTINDQCLSAPSNGEGDPQ